MKIFLLRLGLAAIIFPVLWLLIFVVHGFNYIGVHLLVTLFITLGAFEVSNFFEKAGMATFGLSAPVLSATLVPAEYIGQYILHSNDAVYEWLVLIVCFFIVRTCFPLGRTDFSKTIASSASSIFTVIYPGFLGVYIIRLFTYDNPQYVFLFFLVLVFINEIAAYIFGKLFGGKTKLNLPISPNKTLVGFIAGFIFTVGSAAVFYAIFPFLFHAHILAVLSIGAVMGISGIFGDLFESALKRACMLKDSGTIMAGRGGIMDSIDSVLLSAPLFYFLYKLIV
jgi:phosphatidate cytidylyltransferase